MQGRLTARRHCQDLQGESTLEASCGRFSRPVAQDPAAQTSAVHATDWAGYAEQMVQVLDVEAPLEGGVVERWSERLVTRFERKGSAAGRGTTDLRYRRTG